MRRFTDGKYGAPHTRAHNDDSRHAPRAHPDAGRALLTFARCFGARKSHEVYLSTPITTGEAFVTWRHTHGAHISLDNPSYESLHYEHVIAANITRVAPLVAELRKRYSDRLVIEPTPLEADGWTQRQYRDFWCALIEQYVAVVVLADGWQFSTGCVFEFATAIKSGKDAQSIPPANR